MSDGYLGLALSGGGSRAAAFHRGVLRALHDLKLVDHVGCVSTVSGGSVFGAAWMAARAAKVSDEQFLADMERTLNKGFIKPALFSPQALLLAWPGYSRTHLLASTFDRLLLRGMKLRDLPESPRLVLNACVLNHAQVARFSPAGVSGIGIGADGTSGSLPNFQLADHLTLGFATAASAAFPFGLPPLTLKRADIVGAKFVGDLSGHESLCLTDGGVIENLGVQTLLRSTQFRAKHVIVSDAGLRETPWRAGRLLERIKNTALFSLSPDTLSRLLEVMNNKQNRSMRQLVFQELNPSSIETKRIALMLLVSQSWDGLLLGIPRSRLLELASQAGYDGALPEKNPTAIRAFLESCKVDLRLTRAIYEKMGGDGAVAQANSVGTSFTGLANKDLDVLADHARWQLHATSAIFGPIPAPG